MNSTYHRCAANRKKRLPLIQALLSRQKVWKAEAKSGPSIFHGSMDIPRVMEESDENEFFTGKWARLGDQIVNTIGCADCHDSQTANLKITRPYLLRPLEASGENLDDITHQDMRSLVCAQCHVDFLKTEYEDSAGNAKVAEVVTLPWAEGLSGKIFGSPRSSFTAAG